MARPDELEYISIKNARSISASGWHALKIVKIIIDNH